MAKFVHAKTLSLSIADTDSLLQLDTPMCYTLLDLIQIIKIFSDYDNQFEWSFSNPADVSKNLNQAQHEHLFDQIQLTEFRQNSPFIYCHYGDLTIRIGARGALKYKKVYPTIYQVVGYFPPENQFHAMHQFNDQNKWAKEQFEPFDAQLKSCFKSKYKITDQLIAGFYGEEYELARK